MDIKNYEARRPEVVQCRNGWVRAFVDDDIPRIADAIGLRSPDGDETFAAVRSHVGGRQVDAMLLDVPGWVGEGTEVFTTGKPAHLPQPIDGTTPLDALNVTAGASDMTLPFRLDAPSFAELDGTRGALRTGFDAIDRLAPLAAGGLNLVLDAFPGVAAFDNLCERVHGACASASSLWLTGNGRAPDWAEYHITTGEPAADQQRGPRQLIALRALMSWAAHLRDQGDDVLVCAELPPLASRGHATDAEAALGVGIGEVVDQLGSALASTKDGSITTLVRLPLHASAAGIEYIIETMDVGDVDAQTFVDDQGRFDPYRSTSDAHLDADARSEQQRLLSVLSRAASARDKAAMLGEFGLQEAEEDALRNAEALREKLV